MTLRSVRLRWNNTCPLVKHMAGCRLEHQNTACGFPRCPRASPSSETTILGLPGATCYVFRALSFSTPRPRKSKGNRGTFVWSTLCFIFSVAMLPQSQECGLGLLLHLAPSSQQRSSQSKEHPDQEETAGGWPRPGKETMAWGWVAEGSCKNNDVGPVVGCRVCPLSDEGFGRTWDHT